MPDCPYKPNFTAGAEGCTLQVFDNSRGRLEAGGTFFRSIEFDITVNKIEIISLWQVGAGSPQEWGEYNADAPDFHTNADVVGVKVTIGDEPPIYVDQYIIGSPTDWASGIPALRTAVNGGSSPSSLVTMPLMDSKAVWNQNTDEGSFLNQFTLKLEGGDGPPVGASGSPAQVQLDEIRTGPTLSLAHINISEDPATGEEVTVNASQYWDGDKWEDFDPVNPPVLGGSPNCWT